MVPRVYLDNSIISGMANLDINKRNLNALEVILEMHHQGKIKLFTSTVTKKEIEKIPKKYRIHHSIIYFLLLQVPIAQSETTTSLSVTALPGTGEEDPFYTFLKNVLTDPLDIEHVFQVYKNRMHYYVTVDCDTILKHRSEIENKCSLKLVDLAELQAAFSQG